MATDLASFDPQRDRSLGRSTDTQVTEAAPMLTRRRRATFREAGFTVVPVWEDVRAGVEVRRIGGRAGTSSTTSRTSSCIGLFEADDARPACDAGCDPAPPQRNSLVIRTQTRREDGSLVNEQHVTEFFRGVETDDGAGERAPDHRLEVDGDPTAGLRSHRVAEDQTARYAAASGDDFAIHLDDEFAWQVGLPGRIVHGLCTWRLPAGRSSRLRAWTTRVLYGGSQCASPLLCSRVSRSRRVSSSSTALPGIWSR